MNDTGINQDAARRLCTALLFPAALIFGLAGDAPHASLLCLGAALGSLALRKPLVWTTRAIVYSLTLIGVAGVLGDQIATISPDRFFIVPGQFVGPVLLYLGAVLLYFPLTGATVGGVIAIALAVTAVAGNRTTAVPPLARLALLEHSLPDYDLLYAAAVACEVLVLIGLLRMVEPTRTIAACRGGRLARLVVLTVAMLLSVLGMVGLRRGAVAYERWMNHLLAGFFDSYVTRRLSWFLFTDDVDLWRTLRLHSRRDRTVAVRAQSRQAPGYLRGRAYHMYGMGHWRAAKPKETLNSFEPGGRLAFTLFRRGAETPEATAVSSQGDMRIDIFPAAVLRADVILARGGTREVAACARLVSQDGDGSLMARNWDMQAGYAVTGSDAEAYENPLAPAAGDYLELSRAVVSGLQPVLAELQATVPAAASTRERVAATCRFLQQRCRYELGVPFYGPVDPAVRFITEIRRGHCELFATSAVLLLRMQGIPARYVTGFVCSEPAAKGQYWIARLGDAHAWAEAFVSEDRHWILAEATPEAGVPLLRTAENRFWRAQWDALVFQWRRFFAWLKQGYLAERIMNGLFAFAMGLAWCWGTVGRAILSSGIVLFAGVAGVWVWRRRRRRRTRTVDGVPRQELIAEWLRLERRLARRFGRRQPCSSVREYVAFCRTRSANERLNPAVDALVASYETLRYRAAPPAPAETLRFRQAARALRL